MRLNSRSADSGLVGGCCLLMLILLAAYFFGMPLLVMLAWNYLAPQFGGPQIDYLTAFVAMFLLGIVGGALHPNVTVSRN